MRGSRLRVRAGDGDCGFEQRPIEELGALEHEEFDGALSNFAAFNCVQDVDAAAAELARLVRPGGWLTISLMSRRCLWQAALWPLTAWLGAREAPDEPGDSHAVYYPGVARLAAAFEPWFELKGRPRDRRRAAAGPTSRSWDFGSPQRSACWLALTARWAVCRACARWPTIACCSSAAECETDRGSVAIVNRRQFLAAVGGASFACSRPDGFAADLFGAR